MGINKILLIDDDEITNLIHTKILLRNYPATIIEKVLGVREALDHLHNCVSNTDHFPDVILLDLNMPQFTGWDFLDLFKTNFDEFTDRCKIIILTSSNDPKEKAKEKEHPSALGLITKPLDIDEFEKLINKPS